MAAQKAGTGFGIFIGLLVSIFVNLGLIYGVYANNSAYWQERKKADDADAALKEGQDQLVKARQELEKVNLAVHGSSSSVDVEKVKRDYLKAAGAKLVEVLGQEQLSSEQFAKDLAKDGKLTPKDYQHLLEMYNDLFVELGASVPELNRLRLEKQQAIAELEAARASARKEKSDIEASLEQERREKSDLNAAKLKGEQESDAEKRRLLEEKEGIQKEMSRKEEERLIAEARLESKIRELEGRIVELTEKKRRGLAETDADGEIVHSDQRLGLAWVSLGRRDRLRRGTVFDVFQYVKGGVKKSKGKIEVKKLDDDTAQVAILSQADPSDPIVKGDYIASPFYDAKKRMVFVFVGEKLSTGSRYSMDELQRRIDETGGRVDKTVTIDTDFIVAIENAEQSDEFQKAVQFGVVIMREPELLEYIGR